LELDLELGIAKDAITIPKRMVERAHHMGATVRRLGGSINSLTRQGYERSLLPTPCRRGDLLKMTAAPLASRHWSIEALRAGR